jgi:hypothetical protein
LTGGAFPNAALYLNLLSGSLDSRVTFSRGSNATLVDGTGRIVYAPSNLLTFSEQFDDAAWLKLSGGTGVTPVVTANAGVAPDGTTTADRVVLNRGAGTTASDISRLFQDAPDPSGGFGVYSVYLRSFDGVSSYSIRLANGNAEANITVTPSWQRFSLISTSTSVNAQIRVQGDQNQQTADILVWGAQLEPVTYQTVPGPYVATTSAAYYGPRFDYNPVTLAPLGLLIEEARTNLLTYSADITDAVWLMLGSAGASRTANVTAAPDGTTTADRYTVGTGSGVWYIANYANPNITSGQAYTSSIYVKANGLNFVFVRPHNNSVNFGASGFIVSLIDGTITYPSSPTLPASTGTVTNAGNGWWRITATSTANATVTPTTGGPGIWPCNSVNFSGTGGTVPANFTGDGTSGVFLWGAQLEAGSFATSYIPTVGSTVLRNADVATMTGTNFSSWYNASEGTFVADADTVAGTVNAAVFAAGSAVSDIIRVFRQTDAQPVAQVVTGSVTQATMGMGAANWPLTATPKIATAYKLNDFASVANGAAAVTDNSGTVPTVSQLSIGTSPGLSALNGHIRQIAYFNSRLPNAQLQALTAPPLITSLSLDFINGVYEG